MYRDVGRYPLLLRPAYNADVVVPEYCCMESRPSSGKRLILHHGERPMTLFSPSPPFPFPAARECVNQPLGLRRLALGWERSYTSARCWKSRWV